jgi:hypothetical protein
VSNSSVSFTLEVTILVVTTDDALSFKAYNLTSVVKFVFVHLLSRESEDALRKVNNNNLGAVLIV